MNVFLYISIKSHLIPYLFANLTKLMKKPLKERQTKPSFEINWKIREFFSEAALAGFVMR